MSNKRAFSKGMYDSIPIALAYFAVAFSLGIMARKAGLTRFRVLYQVCSTMHQQVSMQNLL